MVVTNQSTSSDWSNPLEPAAITTTPVAQGRLPILRVVHGRGPGAWQFYDDQEPLSKAVAILKTELLKMDETLRQILDLPIGWEAVRQSPGQPWELNAMTAHDV